MIWPGVLIIHIALSCVIGWKEMSVNVMYNIPGRQYQYLFPFSMDLFLILYRVEIKLRKDSLSVTFIYQFLKLQSYTIVWTKEVKAFISLAVDWLTRLAWPSYCLLIDAITTPSFFISIHPIKH